MSSSPAEPKHTDHPLLNLAFNIIIPVIVLQQVSKRLPEHGPQLALALALAFPLGFGLWHWLKQGKLNAFSAIGLINVLITGGLAVLNLHGRWFILKEVALPAILGIATAGSAFTRSPFVAALFLNPRLLKLDLLQARLSAANAEGQFQAYLRRATLLLAGSFAMSALINFLLARQIFVEIDETLSLTEQNGILNQQIAHMTWMASITILVPSLLFSAGVLFYVLHGIRKLAGLTAEEVLNS